MKRPIEIIALIRAELPDALHPAHADLTELEMGFSYKAPEQDEDCCYELAEVLDRILPSPTGPDAPEWCKRIKAIIGRHRDPEPLYDESGASSGVLP